MPESFVATIGTSGLVKADLGLRLYQGATRIAASEAAITVAEIGASADYLIGGLPDAPNGTFYTLTWEYPPGVGGAYRWTGPAGGVPPYVVLPVRETGLLAADLDLALYRDGAARADALTVAELVAGGGDYAVSGWPSDVPGDWVLRWQRAGLSFAYGWSAPLSVAGGTRYLAILARQRPFPFDVDESGRTLFSCNYDAVAAAPVADFEYEIRRILIDAGLVTAPVLGSVIGDVWVGPAITVPTGNGPFTQILDTGGLDPEETHDGKRYERLSVQIIVRGKNYDTARVKALAIWRALDGRRNVTVAA